MPKLVQQNLKPQLELMGIVGYDYQLSAENRLDLDAAVNF